jgi:hypothetical protein
MTATQERLAKKQKVDSELTKARTQLAQMRYHREAMAIAERRGELITKKLVEQQAAYLMITFRQTMLNLGTSWARRFVGLLDVYEAKKLIDEMARSTLTELANLPQKVTDPNWLSAIEGDGQEEEEDRITPASGQEIRTAQAKAKARRQNKTRTEAKRRARKR